MINLIIGYFRVIEFLGIFVFRNLPLMRDGLMMRKKNLKLIEKWKIYKLGHSGAGCSRPWNSLHQNGLACRSSIFQSIFNFSSEMESGNISLPLIKCQSQKSKILKISITLTYIAIGCTYSVLSFCKPAKIIINSSRERAGDPTIVHQRVTMFVKQSRKLIGIGSCSAVVLQTHSGLDIKNCLDFTLLLFFAAHFCRFYLTVCNEGGSQSTVLGASEQ